MHLSRPFAVFTAGALLCAATAIWVDAPVMSYLGRHALIHQEWLQFPVYILWAMLTLPAAALVAAFVQWLRGRKPHRETAILALAGLSIVAVVGLTDLLLKPLFGRSSVNEFFFLPPRYEFAFFHGDMDSTFPSGHAAMAVSFLAVLWHFYPCWRWLQAGFAALLMFSLVVTRDHFLSDVLAGALLGAMVGYMAVFLSGRFTGSTPAASVPWR